MSRQTITLVAPNGAKVRTVRSKRFFVVAFGEKTQRYIGGRLEGDTWVPGYWETLPEPVLEAKVVKRTDSAVVALRELNKHRSSHVVFEPLQRLDGTWTDHLLTTQQVEFRADGEKIQKHAADIRGRQGEARRLFY